MRNLFRVNNKGTILNFEQVSHIVFVFSLLTLNKQMSAGRKSDDDKKALK